MGLKDVILGILKNIKCKFQCFGNCAVEIAYHASLRKTKKNKIQNTLENTIENTNTNTIENTNNITISTPNTEHRPLPRIPISENNYVVVE